MEPLDEAAIRYRTGSKIFDRGHAYWKEGAVQSIVKSGNSLRARVEGSGPKPYRVVIRWDEDGRVEAQCNCPYAEEEDEWCKHTVAVLLEYGNEAVEEQASLAELLQPMSKQDLTALLVTMSEWKPEYHDAIVAFINGEEPEEDEDDMDGYY